VKKNKNGLYSFAFLEFDSAEAASRAIKELDQFELFGKRMRVYLSKPFSRQDRQS
jgi:RNA recognition motif-containing protein